MTRAFVASAFMFATVLLAAPVRAEYTNSRYVADDKITTLSGTVERIISPTEFTLRDEHKVVRINVASGNPPVLDEGDSITVTGIRADGDQALRVYTVLMNRRDNT